MKRLFRWLADRAASIQALRLDLQAAHADIETLNEALARFQAKANRYRGELLGVEEDLRKARHGAAILQAELSLERKARSMVEADLRSLRDRLAEFREAKTDRTTRGDFSPTAA